MKKIEKTPKKTAKAKPKASRVTKTTKVSRAAKTTKASRVEKTTKASRVAKATKVSRVTKPTRLTKATKLSPKKKIKPVAIRGSKKYVTKVTDRTVDEHKNKIKEKICHFQL